MRIFIRLRVVILTVFLPVLSWSWGHLDFNKKWSSAYLVNSSIDDKRIDFCIDLQTSRFELDDLKMQSRVAIKLWLLQIEDLLGEPVEVVYNCDTAEMDLLLFFGSEKKYPDLGAYQIPKKMGGRWISYISINSDPFLYRRNKMTVFSDFFKVVGNLKTQADKANYLIDVSLISRPTVTQMSKSLKLSYQALFWSTYRVLIHEIGHSFGLCDTKPPLFSSRCDSKFRTKPDPKSVMYDSEPLYIYSEDRAGIRALFKRFL